MQNDLTELPPQYDPAGNEAEVTRKWAEADAFRADPEAPGEPFSVCIPPPNVTAALHLGHALNNTIQDVLVRHARMKGRNAVWLPGTDHAGIATQTVVDRRLQAEGERALKEYKLEEAQKPGSGRGAFVAKVQAWKDRYEETITEQLKAMGCSCDWSRQAFTMDEPRSEAVREAFYRLFRDGLIYRGKRLVNWDPVSQTALADDEVEMEEVDGNFYHLVYPVVDEQGEPTGETLTVATTRPETMLGDTAVAVNPDDPPRAAFIGKRVRLPIVGRIIPVIGDGYVVIPDPDSADAKAKLSTGFLKVTPAHDPNDYLIGQRHGLPVVNVMAPDASISKDHGWDDFQACDGDALQPFLGLSREDARTAIVKRFKDLGLCPAVIPHRHAVGHSYRSHAAIEPYYSDQWYLAVTDDRLKGAALRAMDPSQRQATGDAAFGSAPEPAATGLTFTPARYAKTFQAWHEGLRDWCISRQLWWGHRIPVWSARMSFRELADLLADDVSGQDLFFGEGEDVFVRATYSEGPMVDFTTGNLGIEQLAELASRTEDAPAQWYVCVSESAGEEVPRWLDAAGFAQDPDVLDTWFSSALWPLSTLGWPAASSDLERWNPTSVLTTAREIITLWVSRMVMFNVYFEGRLPFQDVFIHAMIQDGFGQKMSKSLGNGVDPLDIIQSHGADAMRFTLASMTTHTQDVRLPVDMLDPHTGEAFQPEVFTNQAGFKVSKPVQERRGRAFVSSYGAASGEATPTDDRPLARNTSSKFDLGQRFANKLWNATRFTLQIVAEADDAAAEAPRAITGGSRDGLGLAERWILSRLARTVHAADDALARYAFAEYAAAVYDFVWRDLCDWYIEAVKPTARGNAHQRRVLLTCFDAALRLCHPAMPFVTERLFAALHAAVPGEKSVDGLELPGSPLLCTAGWPVAASVLVDEEAERDFGLIQEVVGAVREVRQRHGLPPRQKLEISSAVPHELAARMMPHRHLAETLGHYQGRDFGPGVEPPKGAETVLVAGSKMFLHGLGADPEKERKRLAAEAADAGESIAQLRGRLANDKYTARAPAKLVQETRDQLAAAEARLATIEAQAAALERTG
ncbi:valine--tRNA ligase [Phycisphaera mikurensis]|uniref:Valine--tRNA ligase n=1 Tax=Phycisphaera mikurensis (strain NBRC 102666 / KCTC 22515 / FYK2301M01) TaxID=1142394 RepID=I0ICH5_PHYMF|nr:valine--tRNA ligase [Phycisphaera mikurensis]MBB6442161.1 valyl-tRNA synthetase [Phycisphaera mikurensis]BAM02963.1 valyl-tRNA synthetase [Phycisphaera mikurensis NBRC 102666]